MSTEETTLFDVGKSEVYDGQMKFCPTCGRHKARVKGNWDCDNSRPGGLSYQCVECRKKYQVDWYKKKKQGCILKMIESKWKDHGGSRKRKGTFELFIPHAIEVWQQMLKEQNYRCLISNVQLTAANVSIDHIIPQSKGGTDEIENLRLVTESVNNAVADGSDEDFIEMCRATINAQMNLLCYGTKENPGA